ncbi:hypothetical protein WJX72_008695 [[Myrmecia] bisecta]|uniref:Uncharacterized protein n=1 Tax=[Myrmecia] bisecta TaxID=41462 RepID=A0AAW1QB34_9CHLO
MTSRAEELGLAELSEEDAREIGLIAVNDTDQGHSDPGADPAKRKKKKKKKKKKKSSDAGDSSSSSGSEGSQAAKTEAEQRFHAAVELLGSNDEDGMWIRLAACNIHSAKTRRLCEALQKNRQVTSLDLSANHIGDEGALALASALAGGAAPELIALDLRGNPITESGLEALDGLVKIRKQLNVESGTLLAESTASDSSDSDDDSSEASSTHEMEETWRRQNDLTNSAIVRKYFQVNGDSDDDAADPGSADQPEAHEDPEIVAQRLWEQVDSALQIEHRRILELSAALRDIACCVEEEMSTCKLPMLPGTHLDDLKIHTRHAVDHLAQLHAVLDCVPESGLTQYSKERPQAAVGTHRVAVAEVVAQLVSAGCLSIDQCVAQTYLPVRLAQLSLDHANNNALHCVCLRLLRCALDSEVAELWTPLFQERPEEQGRAGWVPLQQQLAAAGTSALNDYPTIGKRPSHVGFLITLSNFLLVKGDENPRLEALLDANQPWVEFTADGAALALLTADQTGELVGPRPVRIEPALGEAGSLRGMAGRMLSGQELLAMLQNMHELNPSVTS